MQIWGIDFTSRPSRRKPITVAKCQLDGVRLAVQDLETLTDFDGFEAFLRRPGPWIAGFDFPFGQSATFLADQGWDDKDWSAYIASVAAMTRPEWRACLEKYKAPRAYGDREHSRSFERGTGAASPQKLYGVPVALMFYEGARRLLAAGLTIPGLLAGDPARIAVEAYPGILARFFTRDSYKGDARNDDTPERLSARRTIFKGLTSRGFVDTYGLQVDAPGDLVNDPKGDALDAVLCAVQAAWAHRRLTADSRFFDSVHRHEGWIADPVCFAAPTK